VTNYDKGLDGVRNFAGIWIVFFFFFRTEERKITDFLRFFFLSVDILQSILVGRMINDIMVQTGVLWGHTKMGGYMSNRPLSKNMCKSH
jgi:hypothetical protein